jgi:predicted protein tyrosine phosphatase
MAHPRKKVLFVCSRNQWRSPTAEAMFKGSQTVDARSAGTSPKARVRISDKHVRWADLIFAMEKHHCRQIIERLGDQLDGKRIIVLHIPDEYQFMDTALIALLRDKLAEYLEMTDSLK